MIFPPPQVLLLIAFHTRIQFFFYSFKNNFFLSRAINSANLLLDSREIFTQSRFSWSCGLIFHNNVKNGLHFQFTRHSLQFSQLDNVEFSREAFPLFEFQFFFQFQLVLLANCQQFFGLLFHQKTTRQQKWFYRQIISLMLGNEHWLVFPFHLVYVLRKTKKNFTEKKYWDTHAYQSFIIKKLFVDVINFQSETLFVCWFVKVEGNDMSQKNGKSFEEKVKLLYGEWN